MARSRLPPEHSVAGTMGLIGSGLIGLLLSVGPSGARSFFTFTNVLEPLHKKDVPRRHWYLGILGVNLHTRARGSGSAVIQPELKEADLAGLPCYLETAKEIDVTFYQKHGFEVLKETSLPRNGPPIWTMLRPPVG